eukprot:7134957-Lingulodinium_polyedra.AAC.1
MRVYPSAAVAMPHLRPRPNPEKTKTCIPPRQKWTWTWTQSVWPRRVSSTAKQKCAYRLDEMIV